MGTFIIRPTSLTQGGVPIIDISGSAPGAYAGWLLDLTTYPTETLLSSLVRQDGLDAPQSSIYNLSGGNTFFQTTRFACDGLSIYLDGSSVPTDFQHLSKGFVATAAAVKLDNFFVSVIGGATNQFYLQQISGNDSLISNAATGTVSFPYSSIPPMLDIIGNGMGFRLSTVTFISTDSCGITFNNLRIEGTYTTLTNTGITVTGPVPINVGDPLTINTVGGTNIGIVSGVIITYIDTGNVPHTVPIPFTITNPTTIIATVPNYDGTPVITVNITGTIFTGVVPIGVFPTINFTDGSGIYQLVDGKLTDSAYAHGTNPIQIVELPIPNPFVKTALVP